MLLAYINVLCCSYIVTINILSIVADTLLLPDKSEWEVVVSFVRTTTDVRIRLFGPEYNVSNIVQYYVQRIGFEHNLISQTSAVQGFRKV